MLVQETICDLKDVISYDPSILDYVPTNEKYNGEVAFLLDELYGIDFIGEEIGNTYPTYTTEEEKEWRMKQSIYDANHIVAYPEVTVRGSKQLCKKKGY